IAALLGVLKSSDQGDWVAANYLAEIGPPGKAAVPLLIDKLKPIAKDPKKSFHFCFGENSTPRIWVKSLGKFGPDAKAAVGVLQLLLKHGYDYLEMDAATALWKIEKSQPALAYLQKKLQAESPYVRLYAVGLLSDLGRLPKEAVPVVTKLLQYEDFQIR